jgi:Ankyrin repeats (3 copies)
MSSSSSSAPPLPLLPQDVLDVIASFLWGARLTKGFAKGVIRDAAEAHLLRGSEFWTPKQWWTTVGGACEALREAREDAEVQRAAQWLLVRTSPSTAPPPAIAALALACGLGPRAAEALRALECVELVAAARTGSEEAGEVFFRLLVGSLSSRVPHRTLRVLMDAVDAEDWGKIVGGHRKSSLHLASEFCSDAVVFERLVGVIPVDVRNHWRQTPLHIAAIYGNVVAADALLRARANHSARNNWQATPFYMAAQFGHVEVGRRLLAAGAEALIFHDDNFTPLHKAAEFGRVPFLRMLLNFPNPPVHARKNTGETSLDMAARNGHLECVHLLLATGLHTRAELSSAVREARNGGYGEVLDLLERHILTLPPRP